MNWFIGIGIACVLHVAFAAPQFLTFKDGKIGVNFGGYHADAGLGGLLTGNAADGGLSASAGTPWGPRAAAGLGGRVDGRTAGVLYANAEANPSVGASAVLGGSAGEYGFSGSEAHANGNVAAKVHNVGPARPDFGATVVTNGPEYTNSIQKVKPPKKYSLIKHEPLTNSYKSQNIPTAITDYTPPVASELPNTATVIKGLTSIKTTTTVRHAAVATDDATATNGENQNTNDDDGTAPVLIVNRHQQRQIQREQRKQQRLAAHRQRQQERVRQVQRVKIAYEVTPDAVQVGQNTPSIELLPATKPKQLFVQTPIETEVHHSKQVVRSAYVPNYQQPDTDVVHNALQIPIGILESLQKTIGALGGVKH